MSRKITRRVVMIVAALCISPLLGMMPVQQSQDVLALRVSLDIDTSTSAYLDQSIVAQLIQPIEVTKLYDDGQLIGVITSESKLNQALSQLYQEEYASVFINSELAFSESLTFEKEQSYVLYEDIDDAIFSYIHDNHLFSVKAEKISLSNGIVIYVKDVSDFEDARHQFISSYVSQDVVNRLTTNQTIADLKEYGTQLVKFEVLESVEYSKAFAPIDVVMTSDSEILDFLCGETIGQKKTYAVQELDTISGIAWMKQMSPLQLLSLNSDATISSQQYMKSGTLVDVTRVNAPLTVRITQQRLVSEPIYPENTLYIEDASLNAGVSRVVQEGKIGSQDVLYLDVYENDVAVESVVLESTVREEPVQEIVHVGTYVDPRVGTGTFRWPMNNAVISCGWGCYAGHQGIDIHARSNLGYGPIYAADSGVVEVNAYQGGGYGYYVIINHNNGFRTVYAHLNAPSSVKVGQTVTQGQQIGYVGMSGLTTGPHVHFEIRVNGVKRNPCSYLSC